jgi:hypothetical protein
MSDAPNPVRGHARSTVPMTRNDGLMRRFLLGCSIDHGGLMDRTCSCDPSDMLVCSSGRASPMAQTKIMQ